MISHSIAKDKEAVPSGAALSDPETRPSNTGLKCQIDTDILVGIDYLTYVLPLPDVETVLNHASILSSRFLDGFQFNHGQGRFVGRQFANWAISATGILMLWNLPGENGDEGSLRVAISGKSLIRCSVLEIVSLIDYSLKWGARFNRIDLRADDFSREMLPSSMIEAFRAGNYSKFRKCTFHEDVAGNVFESGWTLYLGSRDSDRLTRYYNALPVHGFEAFRFEVEFKNDIANEIANAIAKMDDELLLSTTLSAILAGNVEFIDRSSGARASRCEPLPFWAKWLHRMGSSIRLSVKKVTPTLSRSIAWLERSVASTLAMVCRYVGGDKVNYIKGLIQAGEDRFSTRHQAILDACRREVWREYPIEDGFVWDGRLIEDVL